MKRRFFYYLISISFVGGLFWGIKNSDLIFPAITQRLHQKDKVCVAIPKVADSEKLKALLSSNPFEVIYHEYEKQEELKQAVANFSCEIYLFPSEFLPHFSDHSRLVMFQAEKDVDISKISPDFLGLRFDRLNNFYLPIAYWLDKPEGQNKTFVNLLLVAASNTIPNINYVKDIVHQLLSNEAQTILSAENRLGTVLKDSEIDVPVKSSAVRKLSMKDIIIVNEPQK